MSTSESSAYRSRALKTATILNYLSNSKLNRKRLAVAALAIIFILYLCIWLIGKIFSFVFTPQESPFVGLVPSSSPLAFEGTPEQVSVFLRDRCGLIADFNNGELSKNYPDARILVAIMPQDRPDNLTTTPQCQAYVLDLASNIEEIWNQKSAYPSSVPPFPPCPDGGQALYTGDDSQFTITCTGKHHKTVYNSATGLALANAQPSGSNDAGVKAASNLPERDTRDLSVITQERLASLQDTPSVLHALQQTDISAKMQAQNPSYNSQANGSYYENTITASGKLAQELDSRNIPLSLQELPSTFKIDAPFIIAIANVKEQLPECSALSAFKNIQIWMSAPEATTTILQERTPKSEALTFTPAQETSFQLICQSATFGKLFSEFPCKLPAESILHLNKATDTESWSGRLLLPKQYKSRLAKMTTSSVNAADFVAKVDPASSSISANTEILDLFSVPNLGWRNSAISEDAQVQPLVMVASFNSAGQSTFKQLGLQLAKAFKGRVAFNTFLSFADSKQATAWLSTSPWASKNQTYSKVEINNNTIDIKAGKLPEFSPVSLPQGPSPAQICGWLTLRGAQGKAITSAFAIGVDVNNGEEAEALWIKLEQQSK